MAKKGMRIKTQNGRENCTGVIKIKISEVMKTDSKLVTALKIFEKIRFKIKQEVSITTELVAKMTGS